MDLYKHKITNDVLELVKTYHGVIGMFYVLDSNLKRKLGMCTGIFHMPFEQKKSVCLMSNVESIEKQDFKKHIQKSLF